MHNVIGVDGNGGILANRSGRINRGLGPRTILIGRIFEVTITEVIVGNVCCIIGVDSDGCTGSDISIGIDQAVGPSR